MLFHIHHTTFYRYNRPVALDPHSLRFRPRNDGSLVLKGYTLEVTPRPAGMTEFTDLEGNAASQIWFSDLTDSLRVTARIEVETLRENPFDFIITEPGFTRVPVRYTERSRINLTPYCQPRQSDGPVAWFADEIAAECGHDTMRFLMQLTATIYEQIELVVRPTGEPQTAEATLQAGSGASRDLAVLFMEAARTQGMAARFVSGYWNGLAADGQQYLHAWAEIYFPQNGWRGFDPSAGLVVADQHVPVASGIYPASAASISGAFWGSDVTSSLETSLCVKSQ